MGLSIATFSFIIATTGIGLISKLVLALNGWRMYRDVLAPVAKQQNTNLRMANLALVFALFATGLALLISCGVLGPLDAYYWSAVGLYCFNAIGLVAERALL